MAAYISIRFVSQPNAAMDFYQHEVKRSYPFMQSHLLMKSKQAA